MQTPAPHSRPTDLQSQRKELDICIAIYIVDSYSATMWGSKSNKAGNALHPWLFT